jgi:Flp pilus assembly protein TadG
MKMLRNCTNRLRNRSGQALVEFTFVAIILLLVVFALIDYGRAISVRQVIASLSREGSNLASRNTSLSDAVLAVRDAANPLNITTSGRVIITAVKNDSNLGYIIIGQESMGGISASSKVGTFTGATNAPNAGWIPSTPVPIPQVNKTIYVTEVFYSYKPITPIGKLLGFTLPSQLYDVAYF